MYCSTLVHEENRLGYPSGEPYVARTLLIAMAFGLRDKLSVLDIGREYNRVHCAFIEGLMFTRVTIHHMLNKQRLLLVHL